jgi:hypothetical protein
MVLVRALWCVLWLCSRAEETHSCVCLATVSGSVSLRAMGRSTKVRKCALLRKSSKILRCAYCACLLYEMLRYVMSSTCLSVCLSVCHTCSAIVPDVLLISNSHQLINSLKTKRRPLYLKPQSVPRCKHFLSRLLKPISLCCKWHMSLFVLR